MNKLHRKLTMMLATAKDDKGHQVKLLRSDRTQIIITNILPSSNLTIEIKFRMTEPYSSSWGSSNNRYVCAYYAENNRYRPLKVYNNTFQIQKMGSADLINSKIYDKNWHIVKYNIINGTATYDGISVGTVYKSITPPDKIGLGVFGQSQNNPSNNNVAKNSAVAMELEYIKGYDKPTQELIYDLKPWVDKNGVACLYDVINDVYSYNAMAGGNPLEFSELNS